MMLFCVLALATLPVALAIPSLVKRQSNNETITDKYLFNITLPEFITHRGNQDPSTLDWTSDGCTDSPDNPLGFHFTPACYRHDFGYNNYRDQSRFTVSAKSNIDENFKDDLYYQCDSVGLKNICDSLADVYYAFVMVFGGQDATPGKREVDDWVTEYENKVAVYNQLVREAGLDGEISV